MWKDQYYKIWHSEIYFQYEFIKRIFFIINDIFVTLCSMFFYLQNITFEGNTKVNSRKDRKPVSFNTVCNYNSHKTKKFCKFHDNILYNVTVVKKKIFIWIGVRHPAFMIKCADWNYDFLFKNGSCRSYYPSLKVFEDLFAILFTYVVYF